jgi:hypothetical protein
MSGRDAEYTETAIRRKREFALVFLVFGARWWEVSESNR